TVGEIPLPTPGAGELLVRVAAAGLNPIDCRIRSGELRLFLRVGLPFVCGSDMAGIVEAAGPGTNRFHAGDAVFAMLPVKAGGGYAEYALVSETMAAPAPAGITLSEAASVPLAALTALQSLRDKAGVSDGCEVMRISVVALLCAVGFAVSSGSGTLADEKADLEKEVKKFQLIWTFESSETGGELA